MVADESPSRIRIGEIKAKHIALPKKYDVEKDLVADENVRTNNTKHYMNRKKM